MKVTETAAIYGGLVGRMQRDAIAQMIANYRNPLTSDTEPREMVIKLRLAPPKEGSRTEANLRVSVSTKLAALQVSEDARVEQDNKGRWAVVVDDAPPEQTLFDALDEFTKDEHAPASELADNYGASGFKVVGGNN